jgi:ATP-dependent DNA helicase Rep
MSAISPISVLNPPQREAIRYLDGPLLVLAGAGSGKTRVITEKIVYLIESCGFSPGNIAAITFTNKAAREMQERVSKLLADKPSRGLTISTFHALGVRILREEAAALGYKPSFSILDSTDCFGIVSELAGSVDKATIRKLQSLISNWKSALVSPDQARKNARNESESLAANAFASYSATLQAYQAVDFDDLIALPVALFENQPAVRDKWQNRLRYLLIDEYQDTNASQYQLLRLLAGARAAFTAVGDDDQAIYGWRGADVANLRGLPRDYPNLKADQARTELPLDGTHPQGSQRPDLAQRETVRQEAVVRAWARRSDHRQRLPGHGKEAESVVMKLQAHRFQHQGAFRDYAILYRGNFQARAVEKFLRNQRVPYLLSGGQSFFEKAEIKDITSYLRLLANHDDDPAFLRAVNTPRRGVGSSTLQALGSYAGERRISLFAAAVEQGFVQRVQARQLPPLLEFCEFIQRLQARAEREPAGQVITGLLTAIAYEAWLYDQDEARAAQIKWGNVQEFCDWLGRKGDEEQKTLLDLTQTIALINMLDKKDAGVDAVQLSTCTRPRVWSSSMSS